MAVGSRTWCCLPPLSMCCSTWRRRDSWPLKSRRGQRDSCARASTTDPPSFSAFSFVQPSHSPWCLLPLPAGYSTTQNINTTPITCSVISLKIPVWILTSYPTSQGTRYSCSINTLMVLSVNLVPRMSTVILGKPGLSPWCPPAVRQPGGGQLSASSTESFFVLLDAKC